VARDIIDDRLLGALHLRAMDRDTFDRDLDAPHVAFQAGTLNALMDGHFDGDATVGEVLAHGDHGIGTISRLAGELIVVDGEPFVVDARGAVTPVPRRTPTPFAVVCRFTPVAGARVDTPIGHAELGDLVDGLVARAPSVLAFRVDGEFADLRLRSVHAQEPPYPPLTEVTRHQTEWTLPTARGTVFGFRFPDTVAGVEVPGHHAHFLADDRERGGHVLDLTVLSGRVDVDGGDELHVELPAHVGLGDPGAADRAAIQAAESGAPDPAAS
jgi:acetolactate decarboxylase